MKISPIAARQTDARIRHQRARIEQRHLQCGRRCRLDLAGLLQRVDNALASPGSRRVQGPVTLGDFVRCDRSNVVGLPEWLATLADGTTVVIGDRCGAPSALDVEKAVSIVQSRAYLESRARRLLLPFTREEGSWRLVTIDFGAAARLQACEFLMAFDSCAQGSALSITSLHVEIGFALPLPVAEDPIFVLRVATAAGFPAPSGAPPDSGVHRPWEAC
jgi:hypothetical protein